MGKNLGSYQKAQLPELSESSKSELDRFYTYQSDFTNYLSSLHKDLLPDQFVNQIAFINGSTKFLIVNEGPFSNELRWDHVSKFYTIRVLLGRDLRNILSDTFVGSMAFNVINSDSLRTSLCLDYGKSTSSLVWDLYPSTDLHVAAAEQLTLPMVDITYHLLGSGLPDRNALSTLSVGQFDRVILSDLKHIGYDDQDRRFFSTLKALLPLQPLAIDRGHTIDDIEELGEDIGPVTELEDVEQELQFESLLDETIDVQHTLHQRQVKGEILKKKMSSIVSIYQDYYSTKKCDEISNLLDREDLHTAFIKISQLNNSSLIQMMSESDDSERYLSLIEGMNSEYEVFKSLHTDAEKGGKREVRLDSSREAVASDSGEDTQHLQIRE